MSVLDDILVDVRADLADRQAQVSLDELKDRAAERPECLNAVPTLKGDGVAVIAEVKRSSPSRGALADIDDPAALAADYEAGGAAVISVLTEERRFGGSLRRPDRRAPRGRHPRAAQGLHRLELPALGGPRARRRPRAAHRRRPGAERTRSRSSSAPSRWGSPRSSSATRSRRCCARSTAGATVIGINARNLRTLEVDRGVFAKVAPHVPEHIVCIAESGVRGPHDVIEYARAGADAVLVGESLVTGRDPRAAVADLVAAGAHPALKHHNR